LESLAEAVHNAEVEVTGRGSGNFRVTKSKAISDERRGGMQPLE